MITKIFPAQFEFLDAIRDFAADSARLAKMDEKAIYNIQLVVDEAASNIIEHAYAGITDGNIEISLDVTPDSFTVIMHDQGKFFDLENGVEPDTDAALEDRDIGGLGLFFMRKLMDEVRFEWQPEHGNVLTMVKYLTDQKPDAKLRALSPETTQQASRKKNNNRNHGYPILFDLGEKILSATNFLAQRDLILETVGQLLDGQSTLWLNEAEFHLPDWSETFFPPEPESVFQKLALSNGTTIQKHENNVYRIAAPLLYEQKKLGVIEFFRGKKFTSLERDYIEGLVRTATVSLVAWHNITLEKWRLGQLALVRKVSAQIANEPDIDELAQKVTRLILSTFKSYYVSIFTIEPGLSTLTFRSSAGGPAPLVPSLSQSHHNPGLIDNSFHVSLGEGLVGYAAQTGEEVLVNDVSANDLYRAVDILPGTRSELVLPLSIEERVVGVLDVQSDEINSFHPLDLLVLRTLANNVAVAVEGANRFGELSRQANDFRLVGEVSKQITSFLSLRELMQKVAELISTRFKFPFVHLFTVHPTRRQIHYEAGSGEKSTAMEGYILNLDDSDGIIQWVAKNGETVLANNVDEESRYFPSPLPPSITRSELAVPLIFNQQVVGVLDVQSDQLNAFTKQHRIILEMLGDSIATAIRNADLFRTEQWRRQTGDSLREVAVLLSANASLDQVLHAILTELERNLPSDIAAVWLLDDEIIYCAAVHGARASDLEKARDEFPEATGMLAAALLSRQPFIRKSTDPMGPSALSANYNPEHSSIAVPLRIGDQSVGILTLVHHTPGRYGHEAQAMATTFASYAAVSIENARLYDSVQEQAYASAALLQVAQAVGSLSDIDEILGTIVRIMPILVGVDRAILFTWDISSNHYVPSQHYGIPDEYHELLVRIFGKGEFPLLDAALEKSEMVMSTEAHLGPQNWLQAIPCSADELELLTYSDDRLLVALPLTLKDEIFGVMLIEEAMGGRRFRNRRLEILSGMAQQIALAIQNDIFKRERVTRERLETEVQLARQIQETFIPKELNAPSGWDMAARWRTALQMGGDFYDVIHLSNGGLGLFIADVADKGIPAALFMALTRTLMRAAVLQTNSPAEALRQVNDLLYPDCEQGMFVTAVYGELNPETGAFTYANAGHNPPIWIHANGLEILSRTGVALGVIEFAKMSERTIQLTEGDLLLFYTDGITEAFSAQGEIFGDDRLKNLLVSLKQKKAEEILIKIDDEINQFIGETPVSDDITLIALKRDPLTL